MERRLSLTSRAVLWQNLPFLAVAVVLSASLERTLWARLDHDFDRTLTGNLELVATSARNGADGADLPAMARACACRITLIDDAGRVLADTESDPAAMENHGSRPEILQARAFGRGRATRFSSTLKRRLHYSAMRVERLAGAPAGGFVRIAAPELEHREAMDRIRRPIGAALMLLVLVNLLVTLAVSRILRRRLEGVARAAGGIAAGVKGVRAFQEPADEVGRLARSVNEMGAELTRRLTSAEDERSKLRAILAAVGEGVLAFGADRRLLFFNEAAAALLGDRLVPSAGERLTAAVRLPDLADSVSEALAGVDSEREVVLYGTPDRTFRVTARPFALLDGRGAAVVLTDLTREREMERARREFAANASHELQTPLTVIKGYVETLRSGTVSDEATKERFLSQVAVHVDHLVHLTRDLLALAEIEEGDRYGTPEPLDLTPVVRDCAERFEIVARAKGIEFRSTVAQTPLRISGRPEWVAGLTENLLDNSVKYTPVPGEILLELRSEGAEAVLEVTDSGVGIPEEDLERVFERFYRVNRARSGGPEGTGLGLAIVKHLVRRMGGTVRASRRAGPGSRFTVRLPIRDFNES
jgi:two-component system phosphate regulon sensor histidine kinase PhoR